MWTLRTFVDRLYTHILGHEYIHGRSEQSFSRESDSREMIVDPCINPWTNGLMQGLQNHVMSHVTKIMSQKSDLYSNLKINGLSVFSLLLEPAYILFLQCLSMT